MTLDVVVLATGIADPKWRLPSLQVAAAGTAPRGAPPTILGAFDEAALEMGLRLREQSPGARLTVALLDAAGDEALSRAIAAHRPDRLLRVAAGEVPFWDAVEAAAFCADVLHGIPEAGLVLIGREFGDLDDGALPPCLAERLGWRFAARVQDANWAGGHLDLMRETGRVREWTTLEPPVLASVTNDRRNRLRHPLLKNVMAAKRTGFPPERARDRTPDPALQLAAAAPAPESSRRGACRMLGGPVEDQVAALSAYLLEARGVP